jgi:hypothetical protein
MIPVWAGVVVLATLALAGYAAAVLLWRKSL